MNEEQVRRIVREEIERANKPSPADEFQKLREELERTRPPVQHSAHPWPYTQPYMPYYVYPPQWTNHLSPTRFQ